MPDSDEELERRLTAVEHALDGEMDHDQSARTDDAAALEARLSTLESRVDELDAAVQAVRGFLGGVSAVNEAVERRADAAVAAVERLETRLDGEGATFTERASARPSDDGPESKTTDDDPSDHGLRERLRGLR